MPYTALPMLYCNTVVHRDLITRLTELTGNVFNGRIPDVYSGFALACLENEYVSIDIPMSIGGASGKSNGIATLHGHKDEESKSIQKDFDTLNAGLKDYRFNMVPDIPNVVSPVAESF